MVIGSDTAGAEKSEPHSRAGPHGWVGGSWEKGGHKGIRGPCACAQAAQSGELRAGGQEAGCRALVLVRGRPDGGFGMVGAVMVVVVVRVHAAGRL